MSEPNEFKLDSQVFACGADPRAWQQILKLKEKNQAQKISSILHVTK